MYTKDTYFEDVNGEIIGGEYGECWITYEDRPQCKRQYVQSRDEADSVCQALLDEIRLECGQVFHDIYPNKKGWKFHSTCV